MNLISPKPDYEPHTSQTHFHMDEAGVLHRCYHKCRSWVKIALFVLLTDVICELITFLPIHHLFQMLGWIS